MSWCVWVCECCDCASGTETFRIFGQSKHFPGSVITQEEDDMEGNKRKREEEPNTFPETGIKKERRTLPLIEEEEHCNWSFLPVETSSIILYQATHTPDPGENASALIVCRFVCRQWRDSLPRPPFRHPTSRVQTFAEHFMSSIAEKGYLAVMKWARENGAPLYSTSSFEKAAGGGHLETLKWLAEQEHPKEAGTAMNSAIIGGHLDVMKWLKEEGCPLVGYHGTFAAQEGHFEALKWMKENGCALDAFCFVCAALRGDLEMLRWLHENGCPIGRNGNMINEAAQTGHLEAMKWLKDNGYTFTSGAYSRACESGAKSVEIFQWLKEQDCPWDNKAYIVAAKKGNMEALNWLSENGECVWNDDACAKAARKGHLEVLKRLREKGCPWNWSICKLAAKRGWMECLVWANENGCTWKPKKDAALFKAAVAGGKLEIVKWMSQKLTFEPTQEHCDLAARRGHLEVLKWLREKGVPWEKFTLEEALSADGDRSETLKWAIRNGCPFGIDEMRVAASCKHFGVLKLMYKMMMASNPVVADEWDPSFCVETARSGNARMLEWLRNHGFPWNSRTIAIAAWEGHLSLVKWAIGNGCPFDESACANAAIQGHLDVLKWLRANGCPWNSETGINAVNGFHLRVLSWLLQQGYEWVDDISKEICKLGKRDKRGYESLLEWGRKNGVLKEEL